MKKLTFFLRLVALANAALLVHGAARVVAQESPGPAPTAAPAAPAEPAVRLSPGAEDVLKLSGAKVGDDVIVAYVQNPGRRYNLTADQLVYLRKAGVSDRVLTAMLNQSSRPALPAPQPAVPAPSTPPTPPGNAMQNAPNAPPPVYQAAPDYAPAEATYVAPEPASYYYNSYPYYGYSYSYPAFALGFGFGAGCSYPYYGGYYCRYPYYGYGYYNCGYPYYGGYYCGNGYGCYRNGYYYANGCYKNGYYYANGNKGGYYRGGQPVNSGNNGNPRVVPPGGAGSAPSVRSPGRVGAGNTLASLSSPAPRGGVVPVSQGPSYPGMRNPGGSFRGGSGSPGATFASFSRPAPSGGGGSFASFSGPRGGGGGFAGISRPAPQGGGRNFSSFSGSRGGGGGGGFARGGGGGFARGGGGGGRR